MGCFYIPTGIILGTAGGAAIGALLADTMGWQTPGITAWIGEFIGFDTICAILDRADY